MSSSDLPRISIVTPSLNQGRFIGETVRSVLEQGYPNLEYIVIDGGSSDDTLEVIEPYRDRLSTFLSQPDEGQSDAIAKGFAHATGEILAWLNSDDLFLPDALNVVAKTFRDDESLDWLYSHRVFINAEGRVSGYWVLPEHRDDRMRLRDMIPQETCFWRRALMDTAGGVDTRFQFAFDYELFLRFMKHGRCRRLDTPLAAFREHPDAKTTRQYDTIGRQELAEISRLHDLPVGAGATLRSRIFRERVRWRSKLGKAGLPPRGTVV